MMESVHINNSINLHHADCMEFMKDLPDNYYDLAVVDPPYGLGESNKKFDSRSKLGNSGKYKKKEWDSVPPQEDYFYLIRKKSKELVVFGANHFIDQMPFNTSSPCWIVWDKDNGLTDYADCELAWTTFGTAVRRFKFRWQGMLQQDMKNKEERIHPTQKPVALYEWILKNYAKEGQRILDTHGGSMSIAIALDKVNKMDKMNLTLDLTELDEDYFKAGTERVKEQTKWQSLF